MQFSECNFFLSSEESKVLFSCASKFHLKFEGVEV